MKLDKLIDQLELYSNAIVGFVVVQSLGFAVTFGTNAAFGCEFSRYKWLSVAFIVHFAASTALSACAVRYLEKRIVLLSRQGESPLPQEGVDTLRVVCRAKSALVALFAIVPIGLLLFFGVLARPDHGRCAKPPAAPPPQVQAPPKTSP